MNTTTEPHLRRTLGLAGLTLFGLTYMTAITVFTTYGFANLASDGHLPASYIAAAVAMIFTALSYGAMVRKYPVAGSAYTYTQQSFGGAVGFLTGWAMLLDYLFIPMINFMILGLYMGTQFPSVPTWVFMLTCLLAVLLFNVLGIKLVNRVNITIIAVSHRMSFSSAAGRAGSMTEGSMRMPAMEASPRAVTTTLPPPLENSTVFWRSWAWIFLPSSSVQGWRNFTLLMLIDMC